MVEGVISYNPTYDIKAYERANSMSFEDQVKQKEFLGKYVDRQLVTNLAERFNVGISTINYDVRGGQLYAEGEDKPFIETVARWVNYRQNISDPTTRNREVAELVGFAKIDSLVNSGKTVISFSPPGGPYKHNFIDVFTPKANEKGKYVELKRYASPLSLSESAQVYSELNPWVRAEDPSDTFFLAHPIVLDTERFADSDAVHRYMFERFGYHDQYMTQKMFREIIESVPTKSIADKYKKALNEGRSHDIPSLFDAYINKADESKDLLEEGKYLIQDEVTDDMIKKYGSSPVREVATGCGISGGFNLSGGLMESPFSVVGNGALPKDKFGSREVECPSCRHINIRPHNTLLPKCGSCGSNKIAC